MDIEEIQCSNCAAPLAPDAIDMSRAMAHCRYCGAVFSIRSVPSGDGDDPRVRPLVAMPKGITLLEQGDSLEIVHRWFSSKYIFMAFFCLVWNGIIFVWHADALSSGNWFNSFFGLGHTAVGIGLSYTTLAGFLNKTVIRLREGHLDITHGPIPWLGGQSLQAGDLEQFFCKENVIQDKNGPYITYQVHAVQRNRTRVLLLKNLGSADQALYVEQEMERFLHLRDRPVEGELKKA
ncbi:hypothetical protein KJ975_04280 [Myxococcota bacterium]|nr:hypothetical protein [Myxococcota bacterium]